MLPDSQAERSFRAQLCKGFLVLHEQDARRARKFLIAFLRGLAQEEAPSEDPLFATSAGTWVRPGGGGARGPDMAGAGYLATFAMLN